MPERPRDLALSSRPSIPVGLWAPLSRAPVTLRMQLDGSELGRKKEGGGAERARTSISTAFLKSLDSHTDTF